MAELLRAEFETFIVREIGYAAGRRMPRHAHDYSNVTAVISGDMEETTDAGEHRGRSCSVLLKPRGTMHANYWLAPRGTRCISVELKGRVELPRWQWIEEPETARAALALAVAVRGTSRELIEKEAMALVGTAVSAAAKRAGETPGWVGEVKRTIEQRFDEPLRFERIAREIGLHPVYLSRAFRRYTGMAMGDYVRSLRLRHARHLLSATERPLAVIAADAGFTDASHLCRVFAGAHGVTPRAFRTVTRC